MTESDKGTPKEFKPDANVFNQVVHHLRLTWRLLLDSRVPPVIKLLPVGAVVYLVWPIDLLVGPIDDVAVAWMALKAFIDLCPPELVEEHLREMYRVIPGKWKVSGGESTGHSGPDAGPRTGSVVDGQFRDTS